jgi:hypothetical protein
MAGLASSHVIVFLVMHVSCKQRNSLNIIDHLLEAGSLFVVYKRNLWTRAGSLNSSNNFLYTLALLRVRHEDEKEGRTERCRM